MFACCRWLSHVISVSLYIEYLLLLLSRIHSHTMDFTGSVFHFLSHSQHLIDEHSAQLSHCIAILPLVSTSTFPFPFHRTFRNTINCKKNDYGTRSDNLQFFFLSSVLSLSVSFMFNFERLEKTLLTVRAHRFGWYGIAKTDKQKSDSALHASQYNCQKTSEKKTTETYFSDRRL